MKLSYTVVLSTLALFAASALGKVRDECPTISIRLRRLVTSGKSTAFAVKVKMGTEPLTDATVAVRPHIDR